MGVAGGETRLKDRKMPPKGKRGRPKKGEEKKQRKKKDPNAPKRPMSAYFLFMNATRPTVRKENPDASIGEVAKILGKMWGRLSRRTRPNMIRTRRQRRRSGKRRRRHMPRREKLLRRLRRAGTKKTRRRRKPRTANRKIEPRVKRNQSLAKLQIRPRGGVAEARTLFNAIF